MKIFTLFWPGCATEISSATNCMGCAIKILPLHKVSTGFFSCLYSQNPGNFIVSVFTGAKLQSLEYLVSYWSLCFWYDLTSLSMRKVSQKCRTIEVGRDLWRWLGLPCSSRRVWSCLPRTMSGWLLNISRDNGSASGDFQRLSEHNQTWTQMNL